MKAYVLGFFSLLLSAVSFANVDENFHIQSNISIAIAIATTQVGDAVAIATSTVVSGNGKSRVHNSLKNTKHRLEHAGGVAKSGELNKGKWKQIARALAEASSFIGDAFAIANSSDVNGSGKHSLVQSVAQASTFIGDAVAIANANAGN